MCVQFNTALHSVSILYLKTIYIILIEIKLFNILIKREKRRNKTLNEKENNDILLFLKGFYFNGIFVKKFAFDEP